MKALTWAVLCVASAGCSGPPRDATIKVSCDCVDPNGGVFGYPYEYGNHILCISHDEAQQQCAPLLKRVPADGGRPLDNCTVALPTCRCVVGADGADCYP